jgi:peptide/nickel transport system substrate-binding protein
MFSGVWFGKNGLELEAFEPGATGAVEVLLGSYVKGGAKVRKHGLLVCLLVAAVALSAGARQGSFVDKVTFIEEPSQVAGIERVLAGEATLHGYQITGGNVQLLIDNGIPFEKAYAGYRGLLFNIPTYYDDGRWNPFGDPELCQAYSKLCDKNLWAEEFLFGNALPMYSPVLPTAATYPQIIVEATKTKLALGFDEALGLQMIEDRMLELGGQKNAAGNWMMPNNVTGEMEVVKVIGTIRLSDERLEMGDYFCDQLEKAGFTTQRIYGGGGDLFNYWGGTLVGDGAWDFYTEGWGSSAISLTSAFAWGQMYTDQVYPVPPYTAMTEEWCDAEFGEGFYEAAEGILAGTYETLEERIGFFELCEAAMRENPTHIWAWNNASAYMQPEGTAVIHDLAAGTFIHRFVGHSLRFVDADGAPIMGGDMVVTNQEFLTNAINPVNGSNWTYDFMFQRPLMDAPIYSHPHTGTPIPHMVDSAVVDVLEGKPVAIFDTTVEDGWLELNFVDSISVPGDAWADWDAENQVFLTVDDVYPDGVTDAVHKTTITYPDFLLDGTVVWHDGSPFSLADMVFGLIIGFPFDQAKEASSIYDSSLVSSYNTGMASFRGVKIVQVEPQLIVEVYGSSISLYAETIAQGDANVLWPIAGPGVQPAWHNAALGIKLEEKGLGAFGQAKATELGVDWMNYVDGPQLELLLGELATAQFTDAFIPYEPTLGAYVTAEEAQARYDNLAVFANQYGHLLIGTGPMMLTQVDALAGITVLENNPDYFYEAGYYLDKIADLPSIPDVAATGPDTINIGDAATFDVAITLDGEAYPEGDISQVIYLLIDANGEVAYDGDGVILGDGAAQVALTADQTATLTAGANELTIVVVVKTVVLPGQTTVTFSTL